MVALARRWVTSILAVIPWDLKAFLTPFRTDDVAPNLLCKLDSDRYFPYESDFGLLADFVALCMPEMLASRPICSARLLPVDAPPAFFNPLCEMGP